MTLFLVFAGASALATENDDDDSPFSSIETQVALSFAHKERTPEPILISSTSAEAQSTCRFEFFTSAQHTSSVPGESPQFLVPLRR
jgi:hypothetical protein